MISLLKRLLCNHEYVWVRNIYGDEINAAGGKRSWWRCSKCGKWLLSNSLVDEGRRDDGEGNNWKYCPSCGRKVI